MNGQQAKALAAVFVVLLAFAPSVIPYILVLGAVLLLVVQGVRNLPHFLPPIVLPHWVQPLLWVSSTTPML